MAFTLEQKLAYYRRNPHLRAKYRRTWYRRRRDRLMRAAEIAAVKAVLLSAHRLRAIGVRPHG